MAEHITIKIIMPKNFSDLTDEQIDEKAGEYKKDKDEFLLANKIRIEPEGFNFNPTDEEVNAIAYAFKFKDSSNNRIIKGITINKGETLLEILGMCG